MGKWNQILFVGSFLYMYTVKQMADEGTHYYLPVENGICLWWTLLEQVYIFQCKYRWLWNKIGNYNTCIISNTLVTGAEPSQAEPSQANSCHSQCIDHEIRSCIDTVSCIQCDVIVVVVCDYS